jgi:hypothetical protein
MVLDGFVLCSSHSSSTTAGFVKPEPADFSIPLHFFEEISFHDSRIA